MLREWIARRRARRVFDAEWDAAARDVRTAVTAAGVEIVDERTRREFEVGQLTGQRRAEISGQVHGDLIDLLYPISKEN